MTGLIGIKNGLRRGSMDKPTAMGLRPNYEWVSYLFRKENEESLPEAFRPFWSGYRSIRNTGFI
jgi:hypothetical protein